MSAYWPPVVSDSYRLFRCPASTFPDLVCSDDGVESFARVQSAIYVRYARIFREKGERDSRGYRIMVSRAGIWARRAARIGE